MKKKLGSFVGGGIMGVIQALHCAEIERIAGKPMYQLFDIIGGTSTGGIMTYGLTIGNYSAKDIVQIYKDEAKNIFKKNPLGFITSKYVGKGLVNVLSKYFEGYVLSDCKIPTLTLARDKLSKQNMIMKSWGYYADLEVKHAVISTSAAPRYFPAYQFEYKKQRTLAIDGGVYAADPTLNILAEAVKLGSKLEDIQIFKFGTGFSLENPYDSRNPNVLKLVGEIVDDMLPSQTEQTAYLSNLLVPKYNDLDVLLPKSINRLDGYEYIHIWEDLVKSNIESQEFKNFVNNLLS